MYLKITPQRPVFWKANIVLLCFTLSIIYKTNANTPPTAPATTTLPFKMLAAPVGDALACAAVLEALGVEVGVGVPLAMLVRAAICASSISLPPLILDGWTPALALEAAAAKAAMSLSPDLENNVSKRSSETGDNVIFESKVTKYDST